MVEAMVKDCEEHLVGLEENRTILESHIAANKDDETVRLANQCLTKNITDYKNAAKHCKKHCVAPAAKKAAQPLALTAEPHNAPGP